MDDSLLAASDTRSASRPDAAPDGFIETCDPDTGELDLMAVWLPPGETAESLGLTTFIPAADLEETAP